MTGADRSGRDVVRMGHGPDADDAFVFEPLIHDRVDRDGLRFVHHHLPFDRLNARAAGDDPFDVTMLSVAALARLTGRFLALPFGGSFVRTMGPTLVAPERLPLRAFARGTVAVPGTETTAALLLRFALPRVRTVVLPYDEIAAAVAAGHADAGVVIHEGQIDFTRHGLVAVRDLGVPGIPRNALPTPPAVCAIRAPLPRPRRAARDGQGPRRCGGGPGAAGPRPGRAAGGAGAVGAE